MLAVLSCTSCTSRIGQVIIQKNLNYSIIELTKLGAAGVKFSIVGLKA